MAGREREKDEMTQDSSSFIDRVIQVRRVTKVTKGGKRFSFSALVVYGNQNGKIGIALGKSREVASAIEKAKNKARKSMVDIPLRNQTIPYPVEGRHGASTVIIRSASKGTGVIAGGAVRIVMEVLGVKDILAKSLGASNRLNVIKATLNALAQLRSLKSTAILRGKTAEQIMKGSHVCA